MCRCLFMTCWTCVIKWYECALCVVCALMSYQYPKVVLCALGCVCIDDKVGSASTSNSPSQAFVEWIELN